MDRLLNETVCGCVFHCSAGFRGRNIQRDPTCGVLQVSKMKNHLNVRYLTDWSVCNYSCPYCIAGQGGDPPPSIHLDRAETILENLLRLPYTLRVRLGVQGEFFLSRHLVDLARRISFSKNIEALNLITNLSLDIGRYQDFIARSYSSKIALVASCHPTEISNIDVFVEKSIRLSALVPFTVCLVAYPPHLQKILEIKGLLDAKGVNSFIQGYIGEWKGRSLPAEYTGQEKELLRSHMHSRMDYEFFINAIKPRLCNAGYRGVYVQADGKVYPCGMDDSRLLGDLAVGGVVDLHKEPHLCEFRHCLCDTDYINTEIFHRYYRLPTKNQHIYAFREDVFGPAEWDVPFRG